MMTLLFGAGLSLSQTLHYFGTQDESSMHREQPVQVQIYFLAPKLCYVFNLIWNGSACPKQELQVSSEMWVMDRVLMWPEG